MHVVFAIAKATYIIDLLSWGLKITILLEHRVTIFTTMQYRLRPITLVLRGAITLTRQEVVPLRLSVK